MTDKEAVEVLTIMSSADWNCPSCASSLFQRFLEKFPKFSTTAQRIWAEKFSGYKWEEYVR